jgi:hypothetical protein
MNSGAARLAEVIRADEGLARVMSQVFSAENRAALTAVGAQRLSLKDQLRAAWAPLLEDLRRLARNIAAVLSASRAGDYEALLIEVGCKPFEARILSTLVITGGSCARDLDGRRRELGSALRQIVKAADGSTLVMARRAAVLLPVLDEWTRPSYEDRCVKSVLLGAGRHRPVPSRVGIPGCRGGAPRGEGCPRQPRIRRDSVHATIPCSGRRSSEASGATLHQRRC